MYDKRREFEEIDRVLNEVRIMCNRARIPFIFVAAVYDDDEKTEYKVAADENQEENPWENYVCNTLTPGMFEMKLHDDKIREIVKIMNGFKAVPPDSSLLLDQADIESEASDFYRGETSESGEGGKVFTIASAQKNTKKQKKTSASSGEGLFGNVVFSS